jgi:pyruvate dehydrogenase E1 component beta subunit
LLTPATLDDARGMLWPALSDPNPVILFEHGGLYNVEGELSGEEVDIERAGIRRQGSDVTLIAYGGTLGKALDAATALAERGVDTEVVDLRVLRPLDDAAIEASVAKTHRVVIVDEGWRSGGISAEIAARLAERSFYELDAPIERVCTEEVPIPYAKHLEDEALPQVDEVIEAALRTVGEVAGV